MVTCSAPCNSGAPVYCKGLCKPCYNRLLSTGTLELASNGTLWERLWRTVEPGEGGCWIWTGARNPAGYGAMFWQGRQHRVHRVVWEVIGKNEPTPGLVLDHLCRVRACCNPEHLEQVSHRVNVIRGERYADRCIRGHEFDGTRLRPNRRYAYRTCSKCDRIHQDKRQSTKG